MATNLKHVGRLKSTKSKVLVVFKTLPDEPNSCLVVGTAGLSDDYHNAIINIVESIQAQDTFEFGEILASRYFPDGRAMLAALHQDGRLKKFNTNEIEMTPNTMDVIGLDELNMLIAEQRGTSVADNAVQNETREIARVQEIVEDAAPAPKSANDPLSDQDLARSYRSQADSMFKEAQKLRKQADELDPPVKKAVKGKEEVSA
jgi:hypothetical protein